MNPVGDDAVSGKIGEMLVQLRLLLHSIQAAPPILDSGNDLIALKGRVIKSIQVKTRKFETQNWNIRSTDRDYDIIALVELAQNSEKLDEAKIYLLSKDDLRGRVSSISPSVIEDRLLFENQIESLFGR
ncbi:hypothetical protein M1439_01695 [Candidatus Marsarchaeota archaeon]|jgi:hypothetical protein|nr:hypothetical protein [Candidatus Marsarchaeota archaeon]